MTMTDNFTVLLQEAQQFIPPTSFGYDPTDTVWWSYVSPTAIVIIALGIAVIAIGVYYWLNKSRRKNELVKKDIQE